MAAPANDDFANAHVITGTSGTVEGSNWESTDEVGEPDPGAGGVWYSFDPPTSGVYKFLIDRVNADYLFQVFTGPDVASLTEIFERDYTTAGGFDLSSSTTYYIKVPGTAARFLLHWKYYATAANDDFADAQVITGSSGIEPYVLITAGVETDDPDSEFGDGFSNATIWFKWVATTTGTLRVFTENRYKLPITTDLTGTIGVYRGVSLGSLTHINYAEFMFSDFYDYGDVHDDGVVNNIVDAAVVSGTTYYIEIGNDSNALSDGGGYLHWHVYPASMWDGEWNRPFITTPNPGTNATTHPTYVSGSHILSEFTGSVIPTAEDGDGFAWRNWPGFIPPVLPTITDEGLVGEVPTSSDTVDIEWMTGSPDYDEVPGTYTPHEGGTWEIGFMTNGLEWVSPDSEFSKYCEFIIHPMMETQFEIFEKGPVFIGDVPNPSFGQGYWFIADGRKYRYRVIYESVDGVPPNGYPTEFFFYNTDGVGLEISDTYWEDSTLDVARGLIVGRTSGLCGARYATTEPADCDFVIRPGKLGDPLYMGLRVTAASGTDFDGYFAKIRADGKVSLLKRVGGTETVFGTTSGVIFESGFNDAHHGLILRCQGNEISVWDERAAGSRESKLLVSATDSTFTSGGHKALLIDSSGDNDSGIMRYGSTATAALDIVSRYRCYLSADAGATWELFNESLLNSSQIPAFESGSTTNDFYVSTEDVAWSVTLEGWTPPEAPEGPSMLGYYKDGEWHLTDNISGVSGTLGYFKGSSWHLIGDGTP